MLRLRLAHSSLMLGLALGTTVGCARDVQIDPPVDPSGVTIAQFDPTNPVPVLQLVPTPTALAQNPDGTLNQDQIRPEPCELPTRAQCLAFVDRWPVTTPITLFFSGALARKGTTAPTRRARTPTRRCRRASSS